MKASSLCYTFLTKWIKMLDQLNSHRCTLINRNVSYKLYSGIFSSNNHDHLKRFIWVPIIRICYCRNRHVCSAHYSKVIVYIVDVKVWANSILCVIFLYLHLKKVLHSGIKFTALLTSNWAFKGSSLLQADVCTYL